MSATPSPKTNPVRFLRRVTLLEGLSFLVLVGIAMPLKYLAGLPLAVKVAGWIHGVLFMVVCVALLRATIVAKWRLGRALLVLAGALLPFGPFLLDRRMRNYVAEADQTLM